MRTIVLFLNQEYLPQQKLNRIKELAPNMDILITQDRVKVESVLADVEIISGWFPPDLVCKAHNLRWVQQWGAGADWLIRHPEAVEMDFVLTNASGIHAIPISEHILAFLFTFARGFHLARQYQKKQDWKSPDWQEVFELAGKTLLLIGIGSIGSRTAELASYLGMHVLGIRRNAHLDSKGVEAMFSPERLLDILPEADFVVLTVPLTKETKGIIGGRELKRMKQTAYLINIGRGGTIGEVALIKALQNGWIAGAGLDVFETEPLPEDSPLWTMENVVITAHYAGRTPHYNERALSILLENLKRYVSDEPLYNIVNKELMY
jgi:phosphoglycerate dehydrogenase-like enzyme